MKKKKPNTLVHAFQGSAAELRDALIVYFKDQEAYLGTQSGSTYANGFYNGQGYAYRSVAHFLKKIVILDDEVSVNSASEEVEADQGGQNGIRANQ